MAKSVLTGFLLLAFGIVALFAEDVNLPAWCLNCLCEAASGCQLNTGCSKGICGPFQLTKPYWKDSGSPTLTEQESGQKNAFEQCAKDLECSQRTVRGYLNKFHKDCNADGLINCYDFLAIQYFGGWKCNGKLPNDYVESFNKCFQVSQILENKAAKDQ